MIIFFVRIGFGAYSGNWLSLERMGLPSTGSLIGTYTDDLLTTVSDRESSTIDVCFMAEERAHECSVDSIDHVKPLVHSTSKNQRMGRVPINKK